MRDPLQPHEAVLIALICLACIVVVTVACASMWSVG